MREGVAWIGVRGTPSALVLLVALTVAGCASAGMTSRLPTSVDRPFVAGYHVYWTPDAWEQYPLDMLDELFVFELELGADGRVADAHGWPGRWQPLMRRALDSGVQVVPTVSMHDAEAFQILFADPAASSLAAETVMGLLRATPGLSGVHLDLEVFQPVSVESRDGFTAFVVEVAERMRAEMPGLSLSVFTLAFDDDDVYNERVLGLVADYLVVQGYDYHSLGSTTAGPVGPLRGWGRLNWENVVARFTGYGVPRRKLVMSVPLYGYEWPVESDVPGAAARDRGVEVPYAGAPDVSPGRPRISERIEQYAVRRDAASGSPWYAYQDDGGWVQGWYEDAESLAAKYDFVKAQGLGGIAIFPLSYGDAELWRGLRGVIGR